MSQPMSFSQGDLRAIAHALCMNNNTKNRMIDYLRALRNSKAGKDCGDATDHIALIEQATTEELHSLKLHYYRNEDIKERVENYLQLLCHTKPAEATSEPADSSSSIKNATPKELHNVTFALCEDKDAKKRVENYPQVLCHTKPAEATPEPADSSSSIKNATPKELHNVMLALCEDENAKKRVVNHLRVLRRSKTGGAAMVGANPIALLDSATEMELRAIGLAMSDADDDIKKRLLEYLHALSIFGEFEVEKTKKLTFNCLRCKQSFHEEDNTENSCYYHPGQIEQKFVPGMDLDMPVDRWSCCLARAVFDRGCKTQKHLHQRRW